MSHCGYFSRARSKGEKLGYYRASVACGHCRKRKARCMPALGDPLRRCANCVRLGYTCVVVKVEVMEALDLLGEDGTPENIRRVQRQIGHVKTAVPSESYRQSQSDGFSASMTAPLQPWPLVDAIRSSPKPHQAPVPSRPEYLHEVLAHAVPLQDWTTTPDVGVSPYARPVLESSWQYVPPSFPPQTYSTMTEALAQPADLCYDLELSLPGNLGPQNCRHLSPAGASTDSSDWHYVSTTVDTYQPFPATHAPWEATDRQRRYGSR